MVSGGRPKSKGKNAPFRKNRPVTPTSQSTRFAHFANRKKLLSPKRPLAVITYAP